MHNVNRIVSTAIAGLFAAASTVSFAAGVPGTGAEADKPDMEQCAGFVKGGQNDCATSKNDCHGHAVKDRDSEAWIYVPKGLCQKISGARVVVVFDPSPRTKS